MTSLFLCARAGLEAKLQGFHIIRGEILKTSTDAIIVSRAEVLQLETLKTTMVWFKFGFNKPLPANSKVCLCLASLPQRGTSHDVLPQHRGGRREGAEGLQGAQTAPPSLRRAK